MTLSPSTITRRGSRAVGLRRILAGGTVVAVGGTVVVAVTSTVVAVGGTVVVAVTSTVVAVGVVVAMASTVVAVGVVVAVTVVVSGSVVAVAGLEADSTPIDVSKAVEVPPGTVPTGAGTIAAPHAATSNRVAVHPAIHAVVPRPAPAMAAGANRSLLRRTFPI
ncbi:MAG: hypothetical protein CL514_05015 [Actinobacteria bacterium]|nr:hypothetical protein [Actinomycetota bacterium]